MHTEQKLNLPPQNEGGLVSISGLNPPQSTDQLLKVPQVPKISHILSITEYFTLSIKSLQLFTCRWYIIHVNQF